MKMTIDLEEVTLCDVTMSSNFRKQLKRMAKQGKNISKLETVIVKLANRESLEQKYRDHSLINNKYYKNCRECHIEPDWLLVYQYDNDVLNLLLLATGSHSEIFRI